MAGTALVGDNKYDDSQAQANAAYDQGILLNKAGSSEPISVIYGSRRVGVTRVFWEAAGDSNEYLHYVGEIGEGPISAINTVYLNDVASTDAKFSGYVDIYRHLGEDDQLADANLMAALLAKWTANHRLRGVAYIYIRLKYDREVFPGGFPTITMDVDGRLVYDTRDGLTKLSRNPALCIRDYITNTRYGRGIPEERVPDAYISAAANYCDEIVTVGGVSQARYTCDGVINIDDNTLSNTQKLLSSCRGMLVFSGGFYNLIIDKPESATFDFTEDNITGSWAISLGTKKNMFNRLRARFFNPDRSWQEDIAPVDSTVLRALDNGLVLEKQIDLPFTANIHTAKQIATINLNQSRQQIACQFSAFIEGLRCEVGKVVTITHNTPGWTAKKFRVLNMALKNNDEVNVTVREYADTVYDFGTIAAADATPDTNLPDLTTALPPVDLETSEEMYFTGKDFMSRVTFSWNAPPDAFAAEYDIEYKLTTDTDWIRATTTKARSVLISNLAPGQYDFRVRSVNTVLVSSAWRAISKYVFGKTAPPADVTEIWAEAAQGGLKLTWTPVADIDLSYYKVRWTSDLVTGSWANSIDVGIAKTSTITIPAARNGRYYVKAVDKCDPPKESINAIAVETTIPTILGWNVQETQVQEPDWAGTKDDMVAIGGNLFMDSSVLLDDIEDLDAVADLDYSGSVIAAGAYDTEPIDLGSVQTARCSIELTFEVASLDSSFDDILDFDAVINFDGEDNSNGGVIPQIALSQDGSSWGDWQNFVAGDYTARAFKARLNCYSNDERTYVKISNASFIVDMPDRDEGAADVVCPAIGLSVSFSKPFMIVPRIGITAQGLQSGDHYELTNKTVNGFDIIFKNGSSGVQRTMDYTARAY